MTEANRRSQIELALKQRDSEKSAETEREPLREKVLPVTHVPLDLPVLNHRSFRIAAQLQEHPKGKLVGEAPDTPESQAIISELVLRVHRNVAELKESLLGEGQQQVGMITRSGILLNGNTRCVLLRQLRDEGKLQRPPLLRVAVLPHDYTNKDELELELVLQQQKDLKDDYRFINELVMIRRLRDEGFTEAQIARRRRLRKSGKGSGEQQVKDRLGVLQMMERMRRLTNPALKLTDFDHQRDKFEVWYELLQEYDELETRGAGHADTHLRRWLIAYFSGVDSVHNLRHAKDSWVEDHVVAALEPRIRAIVDAYEEAAPAPEEAPAPEGLELLGGAPPAAATSPRVNALFQAIVAARRLGDDGVLQSPLGEIGTSDFQDAISRTVKQALDRVRRQINATSVLDEPHEALSSAHESLVDCRDVLGEVIADVGFATRRAKVTALADEVAKLADGILNRLRSGESN